ncbi:hypothetical protein R6Z07F_014794 [Ovis aries]
MIAGNGYTTIVPDFFVGQEPWDPSGDWSTFPEWLKTRNARKIDKEFDAVLKYLKQQCQAKRIGVVGFCWGGIAVHHLMLKYPELRAGVSVYGIIKDAEDVYSLKNPTLFIFAENDAVIPLEQVSLLTQKLKEHCKVEYQIKTFSGQTHGFVHRKREDCSPEDKPYIDEARRNLLEWLNNTDGQRPNLCLRTSCSLQLRTELSFPSSGPRGLQGQQVGVQSFAPTRPRFCCGCMGPTHVSFLRSAS